MNGPEIGLPRKSGILRISGLSTKWAISRIISIFGSRAQFGTSSDDAAEAYAEWGQLSGKTTSIWTTRNLLTSQL